MRLDAYEAPAPEQNPPCVWIPLPLATSIRGLKPGVTVRIVMQAEIKKIEMREVEEADPFGVPSANAIEVEVYRVGLDPVDVNVESLIEDDE